MEQIALVDFCRTVVNFQTLDPFLEFVIRKQYPKRYRLLCSPVVSKPLRLAGGALSRLGIRFHAYKMLLVSQTRGLREDMLREYGKAFYEERLRDSLIPQTIQCLRTLQCDGYRIIILSGALDLYVEWFARDYGISDIVTATLDMRGGVCTGKMAVECMDREKVELLRRYAEKKGIKGTYSVGLSDSWSDMPMLDLCKRKIVISHSRHQAWVTEDMEEIIWS